MPLIGNFLISLISYLTNDLIAGTFPEELFDSI